MQKRGSMPQRWQIPAPIQAVRTKTLQQAVEGSLLGSSCILQKGSHVQQSIFYSPGKLGSVCLLTAVEGCDGDVDVLIHGIVAHSIAIWHHWTKAHHAVCLGANLDTETEEMRINIQTNMTTYNYLHGSHRQLSLY